MDVLITGTYRVGHILADRLGVDRKYVITKPEQLQGLHPLERIYIDAHQGLKGDLLKIALMNAELFGTKLHPVDL